LPRLGVGPVAIWKRRQLLERDGAAQVAEDHGYQGRPWTRTK
jgi:hypothetical protein